MSLGSCAIFWHYGNALTYCSVTKYDDWLAPSSFEQLNFALPRNQTERISLQSKLLILGTSIAAVTAAQQLAAEKFGKVCIAHHEGIVFNSKTAEGLLEEFDFVIDGLVDWQEKLIASDVCMLLHKPLFHSGCLGYNFQLFTMLPGRSACLRCVFQSIGLDDLSQLKSEPNGFTPTSTIAGSLLASETIKYLRGLGTVAADELLQFDALKRHFYTTRGMTPRSDCPDCGRWAASF